MKDKLLLLKSENNKSVHDRIWWTYNYSAYEENQISVEIAEKLSKSLDCFIDEIYVKYECITEEQLHRMMKFQAEKLYKIHFPLSEDDMGLYDYGGLNDFFISIAENFQFYDREKYLNEKNMLFDCLNGVPIEI
ncbi:MAG: hypothetical protein IJZ72_04190 [Oscillospiraceae bacterium]|nr:hypothetical protein [Oscillospiraceae bacterium]